MNIGMRCHSVLIVTQSPSHFCSDVLMGFMTHTSHLYLSQGTFHTYLTFTNNIFSRENFWFFKGLSISEVYKHHEIWKERCSKLLPRHIPVKTKPRQLITIKFVFRQFARFKILRNQATFCPCCLDEAAVGSHLLTTRNRWVQDQVQWVLLTLECLCVCDQPVQSTLKRPSKQRMLD